MADFILAYKKAYKHEEGYSNNPNKKENYFDGVLIGSNHGISPELVFKHLDIIPSVEFMINLNYKKSLSIKKREFWNLIEGDNIKNQSVATLLYDTLTNEGLNFTKKSLKKALEVQGYIFQGINYNQINSCCERSLFYSIINDRLDKTSNEDLSKLIFIDRKKSKNYLYIAALFLLILIMFLLYKSITL